MAHKLTDKKYRSDIPGLDKTLIEIFSDLSKDQLTETETEVISSIEKQESISMYNGDAIVVNTFGMRLADKMAKVGGSWQFIIAFGVTLFLWILINSYTLATRAFDPFPYILLNLVLSCLAAIQAPVIMMSQNRKEAKDRARAEADYKTNLKAELEIRLLHLKLDHLIFLQSKKHD